MVNLDIKLLHENVPTWFFEVPYASQQLTAHLRLEYLNQFMARILFTEMLLILFQVAIGDIEKNHYWLSDAVNTE